jgi:photosystem II stability/assembly factor-like uncharacterized protein
MCRVLQVVFVLCLSGSFFPGPVFAVSWFPLGPYGGDARAFGVDPKDTQHLYLGTATGWLYDSHDGGLTWNRLSQLNRRNDLVIDHILADPRAPQRLIVGAWCVDRPDGGLFVSEDGGRTWTDQPEMHGQSVRSLVRATENPDIIVAGTLQGVFRSTDNGKHWQQISPAGSLEIHEIESLAVDPVDPQIIYAGTWHLPWKTTDGGAHWRSIKEGIIEDSDVFSILIDPKRPQIVYASACSGIYKSTNSGEQFKGGVTLNKLQGIPASSRRTRKLMQDPLHLETVYAGTTEGLFRTLDGGVQWDRMTGPDVIVNDIFVDPKDSGHILLATDRGGVLSSNDFAVSFHATNAGFSARQVTAYAADPRNPARVYVGVVNDKATGGVFQSNDGGVHWQQQSAGLAGRDVFSLAVTDDRVVLAGTSHGIFRLQDGLWTDSSVLMAAPDATLRRGPHVRVAAPHAAGAAERLDALVYSLVSDGFTLYAGTSQGLLRSRNDGISWTPVSAAHMIEARFVAGQKSTLLAADLKQIAMSSDGGEHWSPVFLPPGLTQVAAVAVDDHSDLWVGGREGVFYSADKGATWNTLHDLTINQVDAIYFDPIVDRMLLTTADTTVVFCVRLPDHKVNYWDTGWKLRFARPVGDYILGATLFDGMVIQPKMVDSSVVQTSTGAGSEGK